MKCTCQCYVCRKRRLIRRLAHSQCYLMFIKLPIFTELEWFQLFKETIKVQKWTPFAISPGFFSFLVFFFEGLNFTSKCMKVLTDLYYENLIQIFQKISRSQFIHFHHRFITVFFLLLVISLNQFGFMFEL